MTDWFTEEDGGSLRFGYAVKRWLFKDKTDFQTVEVFETKAYGLMLALDGYVMITEADEFVYHEMITHVPVCLHGDPRRIIVIGGGDGGTVRELARHRSIEEIVLCEIDQKVVDISREYFPAVSCALGDPRVQIKIGDGVAYMKTLENAADLVIIDSTDPVGPGVGLFTGDFYRSVARALRPGGLMVAQSESPWYRPQVLSRIYQNIAAGFSSVRPYVGAIPTYPSGFWSWTIGSNDPIDPAAFNRRRFDAVAADCKYLTPDLFAAAFALPKFFEEKYLKALETK